MHEYWVSDRLVDLAGLELLDGIFVSDVFLLLARVVLAIVFLASFNNKFRDVKGFAKQNKLPLPAAYLQVGIEGLAGGLLLLGICTQVGALFAMAAMAGSMFFHIFVWHNKYWASKGGWEYDLMIFSMASLVFVTGGGILAILPNPNIGFLPFL